MSSIRLISTLFTLVLSISVLFCLIICSKRYINKKKRQNAPKTQEDAERNVGTSSGRNITHINFPTVNDPFMATNNNQADTIAQSPSAPLHQSSFPHQTSLDQPPPLYSDVVRSNN